MKNYNTPNQTQAYVPEKPNHVRTAVKTLFFMLIYHAVTWLFYTLFFTSTENQMLYDELETRLHWLMFGFSFVTLVVMAVILTVLYVKNGDRKRAYLAATSVEVRGAVNVAEGERRYRRLALGEAILNTAVTGFLWLPEAILYTIALDLSGMGYGYSQAWGVEKFFVGMVGFCQPFQNAWVGMLLGMAILFCFYYFGRLYAHKRWAANRIRR